jgi:type III pantothenate kinase
VIAYILIGNTNIKVSAAGRGEVSLPVATAARDLPPVLSPLAGAAVVASSVNPAAEAAVASACASVGIPVPFYVGRDFPAGVEMLVDSPCAVGVDRVLNAKAAFAACSAPCAALDFGTALSISVCDGQGRFVGGAICPGVALSLDALHRETALLPSVAPDRPPAALGRNTRDAMLSGCVCGVVGAAREIVSRIERETCSILSVFVTGGDVPLVTPFIPADWTVSAGLTMSGLMLAYDEYRRK